MKVAMRKMFSWTLLACILAAGRGQEVAQSGDIVKTWTDPPPRYACPKVPLFPCE